MTGELAKLLEAYRDSRRNAFVTALTVKNNGGHIGGVFGVNIPREILRAAGLFPVDLYSIDPSNNEAARKASPGPNCALIEASFGYALTDKCPLIHSADVIIASAGCDAKLAMLERLALKKGLYLLPELDDIAKLAASYRDFACFPERRFKVRISEDKLKAVSKKTDAINKISAELGALFMTGHSGLGNNDFYSIIYGNRFIFDQDEQLAKLTAVRDILRRTLDKTLNPLTDEPLRLLICGAPLGGVREKILGALDRADKNITALTISACEDQNYRLSGGSDDPYTALAQKYALKDPRKEMAALAEKYQATAVIEVVFRHFRNLLLGCPAPGLPRLSLVTDYENNDNETISEQLQAFISSL